MSLSERTLLTAPYMAARASFSEALADLVCAGSADGERSYTVLEMDSESSEMRCSRYLEESPIRDDRFSWSCVARVDLPEVGRPVTMMSYAVKRSLNTIRKNEL
jgi:hypothetical protein